MVVNPDNGNSVPDLESERRAARKIEALEIREFRKYFLPLIGERLEVHIDAFEH